MISINQDKLKKLNNAKRISELKSLLASTDFKMTVDYFSSMSAADQTKLTEQRQIWRQEVKDLEQGI